MQNKLLVGAAAILILLPAGVAVLLAAFPAVIFRIPVGLWILWAVCSLVLSLEAPALSDWLTPPRGGVHAAIRISRWVVVLGLINVLCGVVVLVYLSKGNNG